MTKGEFDNAVRRALNIFDTWNNCTGCFSRGTTYYYEAQSIIEDAVHCGAQAATGDIRRLEDEEGPVPWLPDDSAAATDGASEAPLK
jgi:hypothetical protein